MLGSRGAVVVACVAAVVSACRGALPAARHAEAPSTLHSERTQALSVASSPPREPAPPDRASRVVAALRPAIEITGAPARRFSLVERMQHYRVPGVSIAVADAGRVVWARGFGVKRADSSDPMTEDTVLQAASISKVVAATVTLRLVDASKLSLDADVNTLLESWHVPENRFTKTEKVTLRRILSHSAGLTGFSVGGYGPNEPLPTLPSILDGKKPAKTAAIRVDVVPGSISRYSGGGVSIEQLLLGDVTGRPFSELAKELVLDPFEMRRSTFETELPPDFRALASSAHDSTGNPITIWRYREVAAAGLWTTPTDLLTWAIAIANARVGRSPLLSRATAEQMLTAQKEPFGLGPHVEGSGRGFHFGHEGWNDGFHSELVYFPETDQGAAVMVNSDGGRPMLREILYAIAAEYAWPDFGPAAIEIIAPSPLDLETLAGTFAVNKPERVVATIRRSGGGFLLDAPRLGAETELAFLEPDTLIALDTGDRYSVRRGADGRVTELDFGILKMPRRSGSR